MQLSQGGDDSGSKVKIKKDGYDDNNNMVKGSELNTGI